MSHSAPEPDTDVLALPRELLLKHWNFPDFKPAQAEAIKYSLQGFDVLTVLATGYGKSAIFQILALCSPGCAIVVSPLIALMKDQADDCNKKGIAASFINSNVDDDEVAERIENFAAGVYKVFYIAPERINTWTFKKAVERATLSLIVVDEAHCVSRHGHDFRPAYQRIKDLTDMTSVGGVRPPIMAVTATATKDIQADVALGCGMFSDYKLIVGDPTRTNLKYVVLKGSPWRNLEHEVAKWRPATGRYVIYASTRAGCEKIVDIIKTLPCLKGHRVAFYHAGMDKDERTAVQDDFKEGRIPLVVATCAFGMGIDVPNIRAVLHFGIPGCVEDYVQEAGRAGRDGLPSDCVLFCSGHDDYSVQMRQRFLNMENPPYEVYEDLWTWLHDNLEKGQTLALSGTEIATSILQDPKLKAGRFGSGLKDKINAEHLTDSLSQQVLGCLSTMEAYGLVARPYVAAQMTLEVDPDSLADAPMADVSAPVAKVIEWVAKRAESFLATDAAWESRPSGKFWLRLKMDREELSNEIGISESVITIALNKGVTLGLWRKGKVYKGKTTQIIQYGIKLGTVLPRDKIEKKRARGQARLTSMMEYVSAADPVPGQLAAPRTSLRDDSLYRAYIRDYFMQNATLPEGEP